MANQYPTLYPAGFNGTYTDFNKAKMDRSGALRLYKGSVAVPSGTVVGTKIGLTPVRKGAYVAVQASSVYSDALGASVTASIGVTYNPTSTSAEAPATYVSGSTVVAAGGAIPLNAVEAGFTYSIADDGWVSVTTAGATTGSTGNLNFNLAIAYDLGALT